MCLSCHRRHFPQVSYSRLEMEKDIFLLSNICTKYNGIYTMKDWKVHARVCVFVCLSVYVFLCVCLCVNRVSHNQTKISFPYKSLQLVGLHHGKNWKWMVLPRVQATVVRLATITAYLHNHIYTIIKLIRSKQNLAQNKLNHRKGLLSTNCHCSESLVSAQPLPTETTLHSAFLGKARVVGKIQYIQLRICIIQITIL